MTTRIKCQPGLFFSDEDKKTNSKIYKTITVPNSSSLQIFPFKFTPKKSFLKFL